MNNKKINHENAKIEQNSESCDRSNFALATS